MVPLLAAASGYVAIWQVPIVVVLGGVWVFLGGYLLRRNVRDHVGRREAALNRCRVISLLAGLGGAFGGGVAVMLAWQVATKVDVQTIWLATPAAAVLFCLISFLTVLASFQLPARGIGKAWLKSFGPPLAVMVITAIPIMWVAQTARQNELARIQSANCLQSISKVLSRYRGVQPPEALAELVEGNVIPPRFLKARRHPSRKIGYFYHPATLVPNGVPTKKLLVCDWVDNLDGKARTVVYANGDWAVLGEAEFQEALSLAENSAFAAALKEAEAKL